mmetsp:Transcript_24389/g.60926  ORF Transcript_24389/g.60926 Transcript_24389/m.60926 type:complete len:243 (-) Transcript_24389:3471-4199(-)
MDTLFFRDEAARGSQTFMSDNLAALHADVLASTLFRLSMQAESLAGAESTAMRQHRELGLGDDQWPVNGLRLCRNLPARRLHFQHEVHLAAWHGVAKEAQPRGCRNRSNSATWSRVKCPHELGGDVLPFAINPCIASLAIPRPLDAVRIHLKSRTTNCWKDLVHTNCSCVACVDDFEAVPAAAIHLYGHLGAAAKLMRIAGTMGSEDEAVGCCREFARSLRYAALHTHVAPRGCRSQVHCLS